MSDATTLRERHDDQPLSHPRARRSRPLWGLTVPLSKLSLDWLGARLAHGRCASRSPRRCSRSWAGAGCAPRSRPRVSAAGAIGFGVVILLQNAGIERTNVSHAALVVGAVPVMVALMAAGLGRAASRPVTWAGYAMALTGMAHGRRAAAATGVSTAGDLLGARVASRRPRSSWSRSRGCCAGQDPAAVTAVAVRGGRAGRAAVRDASRARRRRWAAPPAMAVGALAIAGHAARRSGCSPTASPACPRSRPARSSTSSRSSAPGSAGSRSARRRPPASWRDAAVIAGIALSTMPERERRPPGPRLRPLRHRLNAAYHRAGGRPLTGYPRSLHREDPDAPFVPPHAPRRRVALGAATALTLAAATCCRQLIVHQTPKVAALKPRWKAPGARGVHRDHGRRCRGRGCRPTARR